MVLFLCALQLKWFRLTIQYFALWVARVESFSFDVSSAFRKFSSPNFLSRLAVMVSLLHSVLRYVHKSAPAYWSKRAKVFQIVRDFISNKFSIPQYQKTQRRAFTENLFWGFIFESPSPLKTQLFRIELQKFGYSVLGQMGTLLFQLKNKGALEWSEIFEDSRAKRYLVWFCGNRTHIFMLPSIAPLYLDQASGIYERIPLWKWMLLGELKKMSV